MEEDLINNIDVNSIKNILAIDVGTEESGYCLIDFETYKPLDFGKVNNEDLLNIVKTEDYQVLVYEEFACYGMPIGASTITSITWNGRYIQSALDRNQRIVVARVYRKDEKMNLCHSMKAKDSNIRQALIDRFGEVGTKKNKGFFYGFKKDIWSAYAVGITWIDKLIDQRLISF